MPPKRNAEQLRAIANGPAEGLLQTPLVKNNGESLSAPYLTAFLYRHEMPVSKERMTGLHGHRLWQELMLPRLSQDLYEGTNLRVESVLQMVLVSDHGLKAPLEAQERLLSLLAILPGGAPVHTQLREHYAHCRANRTAVADLASPPSLLDLFKDERVEKRWRNWSVRPVVLIELNSLLRTWPRLVSDEWNQSNASRDSAALVERTRPDVEELHRSIELEGGAVLVFNGGFNGGPHASSSVRRRGTPIELAHNISYAPTILSVLLSFLFVNAGSLSDEDKHLMRCHWEIEGGKVYANFIMYIVCMHRLHGPLARALQLRATFFDAFADIGSEQAKAFLFAKLHRVATDPAAAQIRSELDGGGRREEEYLRRIFPLKSYERPSDMKAPVDNTLGDLYVMTTYKKSDKSWVSYKIGRSRESFFRGKARLDNEARNQHAEDWHHVQILNFKGCGCLEKHVHAQYKDWQVPGHKEYFEVDVSAEEFHKMFMLRYEFAIADHNIQRDQEIEKARRHLGDGGFLFRELKRRRLEATTKAAELTTRALETRVTLELEQQRKQAEADDARRATEEEERRLHLEALELDNAKRRLELLLLQRGLENTHAQPPVPKAWTECVVVAECGFIDATLMASAFGKRFYKYACGIKGKSHLAALQATTRGPLLRCIRGRAARTWIHPGVAVDFARWLDVKFGTWFEATQRTGR